ncbi:hypothetical protein NEMIN01_0564 [Nematocida minor]|uniref:uncharacterized protein n=1 Tax=Nematocida minor TaxID=1912983 RepID=UPI0022211F46|nr:uncharacterized protein NEMIN01_0564 [Nematocida minor]KAI5189611.1 hypothetical protein NEMIN01_0564 [Nematocida minor]
MYNGYELWLTAVLIEKLVINIRNNTIKNFMYDVLVSNKSLLETAIDFIDNSSADGPLVLPKASLLSILYRTQIFIMAVIIGSFRIVTNLIVLKIPIALFLIIFDHFDNRHYKVASSRGVFDAVFFTFLFLVLIYCAKCTIREAVVFRETHFQKRAAVEC